MHSRDIMVPVLFISLFIILVYSSIASHNKITITLHSKSLATYYTHINADGFGKIEMMFDTGAGYSTINEFTLSKILKKDKARYVGELTGVMADGTRLSLPIYSITIQIDGCTLKDVEVAIFPEGSRMLLGLSILTKLPPFNFDAENLKVTFPYCPS